RIELVGRHGVVSAWQPGSNPAEVQVAVTGVAPGDFFFVHVVDSAGDHGWSGSIVWPDSHRVQTNPAALRYAFPSALGDAQQRSVLIEASDGGSAAWQVEPTAPWVQVVPTQGESLPALVSVTVEGSGLADGLHSAALRVSDVTAGYVSALVGLQVQVNSSAEPDLILSPRMLALQATLDEPRASGSLLLTTEAVQQPWFAAATVPWLHLATTQGSASSGAPDSLAFTVDLAGEEPRPYVGHVVVMAGATVRVSEVRVDLLPVNPQTATLQHGSAGYAGAEDTYLDAWAPDQINGPLGALRVRGDGSQITLLRFAMPEIAPSARVFSATLELYADTRSVARHVLLHVHPLAEAWREDEATWNAPAVGRAWAAAPIFQQGDAARLGAICELPINHVGRFFSLDVTELVQQWVAQPEENHGVAVLGQARVSTQYTFSASEAPDYFAEQRPRLSFTYGEMPRPTPSPTATPTPTPSPTATPNRSVALPLIWRRD
ncbi:MAG: DNRLRE domain-containing protein, partial [Anaerolineae bacterium]|nr:DNRLRE domain-containing protein [Anaerolineae bacterium]